MRIGRDLVFHCRTLRIFVKSYGEVSDARDLNTDKVLRPNYEYFSVVLSLRNVWFLRYELIGENRYVDF